MVICHAKKCIFIHIPKTAGTSIEQFIKDKNNNSITYLGVRGNRSMHHFSAIELKMENVSFFDSYYKFSIVRNPYDRLLSEYYWCPIPGVGYKYGRTKRQFLQYVINVVKKKLYYDNIFNDHFIPQYLFLYKGKTLLINQLFKYEDLEWTVDYLKRKLDLKSDFPFLNKSSDNKKEWTVNQKEIIYKLYNKDFILFNYEK